MNFYSRSENIDDNESILDEIEDVKKISRHAFQNTISFLFGFMNLLDLSCIIPFWMAYGPRGMDISNTAFLRILRVLRVFKMVRFLKKPRQFLELIWSTMVRSMPALGVLLILLLLVVIFFGFLIYFCESGIFQVTEEYPQGQFLRKTINGYGHEISPFTCVPAAIYFILTTGTTGETTLL